MKKIYILLIILLIFRVSVFAQGFYFRPIISFQYNMIIGSGSNSLSTSPKAFGSGIYDFSQKIGVSHLFQLVKDKLLIEYDVPLLTLEKYRFANNIYFSNQQIILDTNSLHSYSTSFFSRTGSKLTLIGFQLPLYLVYKLPGVHNSFFKFGIFGEYRITGWHKLIFYTDNNIKVVKTNFSQLHEQGLRVFNWGISTGLRLNKIYFFSDLGLRSLFAGNKNFYQLSGGFYYFLSLNSLKKIIKKKTKLARL